MSWQFSPMHRVLVYRRKFLPKSETFIYEQLIGHHQVKTMVLTRQRPFNRKQFPYSPVYVRKRMTGLSTWLKHKKIKCVHARFGPAGLEMLPHARKAKLPIHHALSDRDQGILHEATS